MRIKRSFSNLIILIIIVLLFTCFKKKEYGYLDVNWLRFRGVNGNGISEETGWNPKALKRGKNIKWYVNVGEGYSSVIIDGNYIYTNGYYNEQDTLYCLNVNDGCVVWSYSYSIKKIKYNGTRATPIIDGNFIYTISNKGDVICLNKTSGKIIWKKNIINDFNLDIAYTPAYGFCSSPVIKR